MLAAISAVGALLAAAIAGPMSDRPNRRKPFVFLSLAVAGAGCIVPVLSPRSTMELALAARGRPRRRAAGSGGPAASIRLAGS